jgi:hypothetical protein
MKVKIRLMHLLLTYPANVKNTQNVDKTKEMNFNVDWISGATPLKTIPANYFNEHETIEISEVFAVEPALTNDMHYRFFRLHRNK